MTELAGYYFNVEHQPGGDRVVILNDTDRDSSKCPGETPYYPSSL